VAKKTGFYMSNIQVIVSYYLCMDTVVMTMTTVVLAFDYVLVHIVRERWNQCNQQHLGARSTSLASDAILCVTVM